MNATFCRVTFSIFISASELVQAQLMPRTEEIHIEIEPSSLLRDGQTVKITPKQISEEFSSALIGAGIRLSPIGTGTLLRVRFTSYDSGPYLGFSKTARMTVEYRLQRANEGDAVTWQDSCEAKVGVDFQDAPERNRAAVKMCLAGLGLKLSEKLVGAATPTIVS